MDFFHSYHHFFHIFKDLDTCLPPWLGVFIGDTFLQNEWKLIFLFEIEWLDEGRDSLSELLPIFEMEHLIDLVGINLIVGVFVIFGFWYFFRLRIHNYNVNNSLINCYHHQCMPFKFTILTYPHLQLVLPSYTIRSHNYSSFSVILKEYLLKN